MKTQQTPTRPILWTVSLMLVASASPLFGSDSTSSSATTRSGSSTGTSASETRVMGTAPVARGDRRFVEKIGKLGMEEVALSKIAAERTTRADVRAFAQELVATHEKVNLEITQLAATKGITLPMNHQPNTQKWTKKDADDFDEDYLEKMIDAHKESVELLEDNARDSKDTELASFARTHLAAMQEHLRKAQDLKKLTK